MAQRAQYKPDRKGIARLLRSPEVQKAVRLRAEQAAVLARMRLPKETGELSGSVRVEPIQVVMRGGKRDGWQVVVDAPYAAPVEFGTREGRRGAHVLGSVADTLRPKRRRV